MPASRWHQEITWNYNWFPDQKSVLQEKKWLLWITSKKWHHILVARTGLIVLIQDLVNDPVWDKAAHRVFCVKKLYGKEGVTKSMAWPVILSRVYFLIFGLGDYWWNLKQSYAHLKLQWFWKGNRLQCQCTIFRSLKERANRERVGGGSGLALIGLPLILSLLFILISSLIHHLSPQWGPKMVLVQSPFLHFILKTTLWGRLRQVTVWVCLQQ